MAVFELAKLTDVELVSIAGCGREDVFEELVRRYQRQIFSYLFRMLNDHDAALDVSQEVFIKVYRSLDRYSSAFKFSTWLYRIAHNAAIDNIRRRAPRSQTLECDVDDAGARLELASDIPTPERQSENDERRHEIRYVVRCLPAAYRELIVLRHGHDLSYDEIGEVTGLPLGTVKNRLFRAREMMREILLESGIDKF